ARVWSRWLQIDAPARADHAGTELDTGQVPLADRAGAEYEPGLVSAEAALIGMGDHGRVAQRRALDRVFVGEVGAEQEAPGAGERGGARDAMRDGLEVVREG